MPQPFTVKLAETQDELRAAQALRYEVFVKELGADGPLVDHDAGLEMDRFDPFFDHMIVVETATDKVVGVYRLLSEEAAMRAGQFYSEDEYDLTPLRQTGLKMLELGRSCLHRDYRSGLAMVELWSGLARYVTENHMDILFGVASFHGTDPTQLAQPLSLLHHLHLAPDDLRLRAQPHHFQTMDLMPADQIDRRAALVQIPSLIKAYLRLGGFVGEGAFIDHSFNTTDVCLILDTNRMSDRQRMLYTGGRAT